MVRRMKDIDDDEILVYYKGEARNYVNPFLLNQQNAWGNLEDIKNLHWLRYLFFEMIQETEDITKLRDLAEDLTEIEFKLQELWGFSRDKIYHRFWEVPKCSCPSLDNMEAYPHRRIVVQNCKLHGWDE